MSSDIRIDIETKAEVSAQATAALKACALVVTEVDVSATAEIMTELLVRGEISFPGLPGEDDPGEPDEGLADALASDFDWTDEDEEPPADEVPRPRHVYVLRVCRNASGDVCCLPPYSDWSGAQGRTLLGRRVLQNHNNRLLAYRTICEALTKDYAQQLLKGPEALGLGLVQKAFADRYLSAEGVGKDQLSRFLHNCDLVWDEDVLPGGVSMPVRNLFQE